MTELTPTAKRFVLHWGEMGSKWGVNRTVAQIHALLYVSDNPMTAEDIAERLAMARSNVSTSLRELIGWGLIRRVHVMGDRRDHYPGVSQAHPRPTRCRRSQAYRQAEKPPCPVDR